MAPCGAWSERDGRQDRYLELNPNRQPMIKHALCNLVLRHNVLRRESRSLDRASRSFDVEDATQKTQDFHLHTKARMGYVPILSVGGVVGVESLAVRAKI